MVTVFCFIFVIKVWTRSSHKMWKTRLQTLCIILESQFGITIPKRQNLRFQNLCLQNQNLPRQQTCNFPPFISNFSNAKMNILSFFRPSSTAGVLSEENMPFEIRHREGYEKKHKCQNTVFFPQSKVYTNFQRTVRGRC